ncbi:MAG: hypothetical protein C0468_03155 [Planctomyces sp.]|nr:hypothetical protein [Planctomyces sp.]
MLTPLVQAQEFGLVVVIGLMMAGLTLASWLKDGAIEAQVSRVEVPEGASVRVEDERLVLSLPGQADQRVFARGAGWGLGTQFGKPVIEQRQRVRLAAGDRLERIEPGFLVRQPGQGGAGRPLLRRDGWVLVDDPAPGALVREDADTGDPLERIELIGGVRADRIWPGQTLVRQGQAAGKAYLEGDGWFVYEAGDGTRELARAFRANKFLRLENLINVATSASFIAIMAVGMTGIIVMGGIDLSIGSIYALAWVAGAVVMREVLDPAAPAWVSVTVGLLVCAAAGGLAGLVNGASTVGLGVHPFIITLGGMAIYRGVAFVLTGGLSVNAPESFSASVKAGLSVGGVVINPIPTGVMVVAGLLGAVVAARTVFGRRVFAIGGNETAARYAGVPVGRTKIVMFTLTGLLAGVSAMLALGYFGAGSSEAGRGYELEVIAAAVVGGASLSGGRGSALGAVLGALIIQLINNGFDVLQIDSNYRQIVIGFAIVLAVVVDQAKGRLVKGPRGR